MLEIEAFDEQTINELRRRARDALVTAAIKSEETMETGADDLVSMEGMDTDTAHLLASKGVRTMEDLADLAIDELTDITGMDEARAKELIMTARAPWFAAESA
jgi:N utilization substance protein A